MRHETDIKPACVITVGDSTTSLDSYPYGLGVRYIKSPDIADNGTSTEHIDKRMARLETDVAMLMARVAEQDRRIADFARLERWLSDAARRGEL